MRSSLLLLVLCCWTVLARPADLHVALWMAEAGGVAAPDEGLHAFNGPPFTGASIKSLHPIN